MKDSSDPGESLQRAYDALAPTYDKTWQMDAWIRRRLHEKLLEVYQPGMRILDLGAGTGESSIFLAKHGVIVHAIDSSQEMLNRLAEKTSEQSFSTPFHIHKMVFYELEKLPISEIDGAISLFGAFNTCGDPDHVANVLATLLKPGDKLLVHMVNPWSIWEYLHLVRKGNFRAARRLGSSDYRKFRIASEQIGHYMPTSREAFERHFEPFFDLVSCIGMGIVDPPGERSLLPTMIRPTLRRLDEYLGGVRPFTDWGRFFLLEMERRVR